MNPYRRLVKLNTFDNLWLYILFLLEKKSYYAWELPNAIQDKFKFKPGKITPYRVLYRLKEQDLVKSHKDERKRIYEITDLGREELKKARNFYNNLINSLDA